MSKAIFNIDESAFTNATANWQTYVEENNLHRGPALFRTAARLIYNELFARAIVKYLNSPDGSVEFDDNDNLHYIAATEHIKAIFDDPNVLINGLLIETAYATLGEDPNMICRELGAKICSSLDIPDVDLDDEDEGQDDSDGNRILRLARKSMDLSADEDLIKLIIGVLETAALDAVSNIDWSTMDAINDIAKQMEKWPAIADTVFINGRILLGTF